MPILSPSNARLDLFSVAVADFLVFFDASGESCPELMIRICLRGQVPAVNVIYDRHSGFKPSSFSFNVKGGRCKE